MGRGRHPEKYLLRYSLLKLPTIDSIKDQINNLGKGFMLYKVDVSLAFRHIKLGPSEYDFCLCHPSWFIDTSLPFGYCHGSALFQNLSDAI